MRLLYLVTTVLFIAGSAHGDPAILEGGVFIAHYAPSLTYTTDTPDGGWGDALQASADSIHSCEDQNNRIDGPADHAMWFKFVDLSENEGEDYDVYGKTLENMKRKGGGDYGE